MIKILGFKDTKTLEEDRDRFLDLRKKFLELMTQYGYPDTDARVMILNNFCGIINSSIMNMSILVSLDKKIIRENDAKRILGMSDVGNFHSVMMNENDLRRISFLTMFQFQLETLFKILLSSLDVKPDVEFSKVVNQVIKKLSLPQSDQKRNILNSVAYIRNCLHSNGVHNRPSMNIGVNGYIFRFEKGMSFNQAKWAHIHFLIDSIFSILEEILNHTEIQSIPPPLPYKFSS
jgi:uncharacterized protein (DUF2267 family)